MKTRILIFILTFLSIVSCKRQGESADKSATQLDSIENTFVSCFSNMDTTKAGHSIACSAGIYKLINDRYVVRLLFDFPVSLDSCYTISVDSLNGEQLAELLIFDNKNASLTNICTDVIISNYPGASRKLYAHNGELVVAFSDPTDYYGNMNHHTTVVIKKLVFIDNTGEKIELENELLWKVLDLGTPG